MSRTSRERYTALRQSAWRHPKVRKCSKGARSLWFMSLSYVPDFKTDGLVPSVAVPMLDGTKGEVAELLGTGLWEVAGDDFIVHAYLEHNPSDEELETVRASRRLAGAKGGRRKAERVASATANGLASATDGLQQTGTKNVPDIESESDRESDLPLSPPGGITGEYPIQAQADPVGSVSWLLGCPPKPGYAWRLLHAIAELHPGPDGRPVILPGLAPSANDRTKLATILEGAEAMARDSGSTAMGELAAEWLALLSLIAAGEMERPKGPMVPYLLACFGRLEERRRGDGIPFLPARTEVAA